MWCIGELTEEYRHRTYALLALYAQPFDPREPVVCIDEKSLQLIGHSRAPLPMSPGILAKDDYEYVRRGTSNLFVAVEPKAGQRVIAVTAQRGKVDFVEFIASLLGGAYARARRVHLVLDNLNIHFRKCFDDVLGCRAAAKLLRRVQFHYTPQARELAEHGGDRNRHPQPPMPGSSLGRPPHSAARSRAVAARSQRCQANHRVEVHSTGCGSEARAPLRSVIYVLMY